MRLSKRTEQYLINLTGNKKFDKAFEQLDKYKDTQFNDAALEKIATSILIELEKPFTLEDIDKMVWFLKLAKLMG
jgi:ribonucleotide reductase alpha subunit